jgi:hypothetical protein
VSFLFRVVAFPDPQTLPRIVGIFAQRSLVPTFMASDRRGDMLHVEARLDDLDPAMAAIIAAKLGEAVLVVSAMCHPAGEAEATVRAAA